MQNPLPMANVSHPQLSSMAASCLFEQCLCVTYVTYMRTSSHMLKRPRISAKISHVNPIACFQYGPIIGCMHVWHNFAGDHVLSVQQPCLQVPHPRIPLSLIMPLRFLALCAAICQMGEDERGQCKEISGECVEMSLLLYVNVLLYVFVHCKVSILQ